MESLKSAVYTPRAIINIFNNAIRVQEERVVLDIRGVYSYGNNVDYKGYYYDLISEEGSEASMTLVVPATYRQRMSPGKVVELKGFVSRRLDDKGGYIRISIHLMDLVKEVDNKFSDFEMKAVAIQKMKANSGFRNVDYLLQNAVTLNEPPKIVIIIGTTSIIDKDILNGMEASQSFFQPKFIRVNLNSPPEILQALSKQSGSADILVVSRGGGENLETFNNLDLARESIKLKPLLITAIGHAHDISLLDKVADKSFSTPTSFGNYLKDLHNKAYAQAESSRATLSSRIEMELRKVYSSQIDSLNRLLKSEQKRSRYNRIALAIVLGVLIIDLVFKKFFTF